ELRVPLEPGEPAAERPGTGKEEVQVRIEPDLAHVTLRGAECEVRPERRREEAERGHGGEEDSQAKAPLTAAGSGDERVERENGHGQAEVEGQVHAHQRVRDPADDPEGPVA